MLKPEHLEQLIGHAAEAGAVLAESFAQCFDIAAGFQVGDSELLEDVGPSAGYSGPGLVVLVGFEDSAMAVLLPATLPLPDWYAAPTDSQKSRLETLAMEWSMNLLPPDFEATSYATLKVDKLLDFVRGCGPMEAAAAVTIDLSGGSSGKLLLVGPLGAPQYKVDVAPAPAAAAASSAATPAATVPAASQPMAAPPPAADPLARLRHLPVTISVRVAEKRIPVAQLLGITAGALITFPKSSEAPLDLYVNNALYCRGEAVKIGEHFGLKIDQVGVVQTRAAKVLTG